MVRDQEQQSEDGVVHVIDDDADVRWAVIHLLQSIGLRVSGHVSAEEFLGTYDPTVAGCVVVDVCMPGMSGLDLQTNLIESGLTVPVIILTGHADVPMAVEAMSRGALAFLEKPYRAHEFLELVKDGLRVDRTNRLRECRERDVLARFERLSQREAEVMDLLAGGDGNKQVARLLEISERTVESHRARIMEKLEAGSLAEFIELVLEHRAINRHREGKHSNRSK